MVDEKCVKCAKSPHKAENYADTASGALTLSNIRAPMTALRKMVVFCNKGWRVHAVVIEKFIIVAEDISVPMGLLQRHLNLSLYITVLLQLTELLTRDDARWCAQCVPMLREIMRRVAIM